MTFRGSSPSDKLFAGEFSTSLSIYQLFNFLVILFQIKSDKARYRMTSLKV